jgi:filamentous hemagglutinin
MRIRGNTDLTGAYIASTADASKNSLTTGTLTFSDIQNQSHYSATSTGVSAGVGVGNTGKATGPGSVSGSGGAVPMALNENGDQSSATRSAVSGGTVTVTDAANQTQDVANLSRDTTNTNGTVAKTPDVNAILNQQADTMQAAQAAGQVVAQGIAAYANDKQETAQKAADAAKLAGDMDSYATYQAEANSWAEGGANRTELHIAGGALLGGLGGGGIGSAAAGAAGAGVASALAGKLNGLADQIGGATGSMTLGNVTSNVLAGLSGAVVGGGMGALTASNADLYNRSTGNGNGTGGTGSQVLDWIGDQLASAGRGAENLTNQFAALVNANGPQGPYVNPDDLNGPGGNSKPPATGGSAVPVAVCVPPVCAVVPAVTPGTPGYGAGNAIFNDSGDAAKSPSTPTGMSGSPMDVPRGTNAPATINGVEYSAHAVDQMQGRGVPPSAVKNTIENGVIYPTREGTTGYYDPVNNMRVITNSKTGSVVTVIPGAPGK